MAQEWAPSTVGRFLTGGKNWSLGLFGDSPHLALGLDGRPRALYGEETEARILMRRGLFWSSLTLEFAGERPIRLNGLPNRQFTALEVAVSEYKRAHARISDVKVFSAAWEPISAWCQKADALFAEVGKRRRRLTSEEEHSLLQARLNVNLGIEELQRLFREPHVHTSVPYKAAQFDLEFWPKDLSEMIASWNRKHVESELVAEKELFDRVEKNPLTEEQARAVVCFDNRVQLVAAAGSGKTSTMAAKELSQ
ncbi:DNA/RNA helicase superfamily I [Paraburkholderia hospita]|uniref:DNA/RNA helicase superfamily I n=1 Tax=Paraburkholderia hospita TaxID=169430 RepID=UPI00027182E6|nr:DNA/RNA helicase superfamily I [Paraburkholderia hospita]EUC20704.1 DNA helicase IV / RNA helicase domain-containing protein [Burkholderia sp. BT03]SKC45620.1 UvrD/REP helicase N-terminal domain-containing protein [Paraburkholderia hospita]